MAITPLVKKLGLKPRQRAIIINAPAGYIEQLDPLPEGGELAGRPEGQFDFVQLFVSDKAALERDAPAAIAAIKPGGLLWITYHKRSSGIKTDISRDNGWDVVNKAGWGGVSLIAIDETWSAMRFRPGARL
ncbi:MAG: hypothetical protein DLM69_05275 [Candidatus Chloroheliales bacterium]|nr:MAG: hypothetical protein DLM69_05275 [Chloroflexota bacterium]